MLIDARLRHDCGWTDAHILNISRRGLMARAEAAPRRGTYVEICRGSYRIVARVVWVKNDRFGALAQDSIEVDAIATGKHCSPPPAANLNDRRHQRRQKGSDESEEHSRTWSRRLEFIAVSAAGVAAACLAFNTVSETLSKPLNSVESALARSR